MIGDQHIPSIAYFGNPRQSEAEAIALVHVPNVGDYYFDFGQEKYRSASSWEFVRLGYGIWTWGRMTKGQWNEPLPTLDMNETRLRLADGKVLVIPF
jgi:hypothetical protein